MNNKTVNHKCTKALLWGHWLYYRSKEKQIRIFTPKKLYNEKK